jgi:hypothetical protein
MMHNSPRPTDAMNRRHAKHRADYYRVQIHNPKQNAIARQRALAKLKKRK